MNPSQLHKLTTAFNSGVLSPYMDPRTDVEKYASGLRIGTNTLVRPFGAVAKRPGFEYLGNTKLNQPTRFMPFNFDTSTKFTLAFSAGALRFWSNGLQVAFPISSAAAWSGSTSSYPIGTWAFSGGTLYAAKVQHTPSGGNQPPSTSWSATGVKPWTTTTSYVVGDFVAYGPFYIYVCTTAHTSGSSFDATKFSEIMTGVKFGWATSNPYAVGIYVTGVVSGVSRYFRCKTAHTSGAATQPGIGASWATYWTEYTSIPVHNTASFAYKTGDPVRVGTDVYFATSNNTSSTSNEPLDAGSPWSKMTSVKAWDGTSTARVAGDVVLYGGNLQACIVAHTSSTYITLANWSVTNGTNYSIGSVTTVSVDAWTSTPAYDVNTIVSNGANKALFLCVKQHDTASTTEPGTSGGADYWQKLRNVFFWTTGDNYVAGQYVFHGTGTYRVLVDHTAGTFATDLAANDLVLEDYTLELETAYAEADLFKINSTQANDVMFLFCKGYEPKLLRRFGDTVWLLSSVPWDSPPVRDENILDDHTLTASATTGTGITLTASHATFLPGNAGGFFNISHKRDNSTVKLVLSANGQTSGLRIKGQWNLFVYGTAWKGEVIIETSNDGSTNWLPLRSWNQAVANMRTITATGTQTEEVFMRIRLANYSTGTTTDYAVLEASDSRVTGVVKITAVNSPTQAIATVVTKLWDTTATTLWSEGAFSDARGWPSTGTIHEARIVMAGCPAEPQVVRMSAVDDFYKYAEGVLETDAFTFQITAKESNPILWVESFRKTLVVGTSGEERTCQSTDSKILSGTNPPKVELQSRRGSAAMQSVLIGEALVFVQSDLRLVREMSFSFEVDKYVTPNLTLLSDMITKSGIKQIAVVRQPDTKLAVVLNNGRMVMLTYERDQNVVAWTEVVTDGYFESVAVTYGGESGVDEVWCVVKRTINSVTVRFVERMHQDTANFRFEGNEQELCYMDASLLQSRASSVNVTGLDHLEGKSVICLADGKVQGPFTVVAGAITLDTAAVVVRAGLPFTWEVQGMKLEQALPDGTAQGRKQKIARATVRTFQSSGMEYCADRDDTSVPWRGSSLGDVADVALRTKDKPVDFDISVESRYTDAINLTLRSTIPLPVNVLSIIYVVEFSGS